MSSHGKHICIAVHEFHDCCFSYLIIQSVLAQLGLIFVYADRLGMFLQKRFERQFDYTGDIPIPVCFNSRKPSYYVHTKQCIQEYDLFTGGLISTIPSGVPSNRSVVQLLSSFSKKGQEYVVACQDNIALTIYDMTRHHYVATTEGVEESFSGVFAATHGGINPSGFACGYNAQEMGVWVISCRSPLGLLPDGYDVRVRPLTIQN